MVACGTWHVGGVAGVEWSSLWVDVDSGIWWIKCDGSAFLSVRHMRFLLVQKLILGKLRY